MRFLRITWSGTRRFLLDDEAGISASVARGSVSVVDPRGKCTELGVVSEVELPWRYGRLGTATEGVSGIVCRWRKRAP